MQLLTFLTYIVYICAATVIPDKQISDNYPAMNSTGPDFNGTTGESLGDLIEGIVDLLNGTRNGSSIRNQTQDIGVLIIDIVALGNNFTEIEN